MEPTILVVDDSAREREDIRDLFIDRLKSLKMLSPIFIEAANGFEAFRLLASGLRPKLILLDYHMPEMNGIELIDEIDAKLGLDTPIIVFSMHIETKHEVEKRGRLFFLKGVRQQVDNFYEEAVLAYKKAIQPSQIEAYKWQLAIKNRYADKNKI